MGVCLTLSPVQLHIPGKLVPLNHLSSPTRPSASYGHTVICTGLAYTALPDSSLPQTPLLFRKQTFSTPGHIYRTIQHLCSWKSLGLDASRVSLLVNCPPASRILQQQFSCRPSPQAGPLSLFFTIEEAYEQDFPSLPALVSSSVPCSSSGNGG